MPKHQLSDKFIRSGKKRPCPICGKTNDDDCGYVPGGVHCCHVMTEKHHDVQGFVFTGTRMSGFWGMWFPVEKSSNVPRGKDEKTYTYTDRSLKPVLKTRKYYKGDAKAFAQSSYVDGKWEKGVGDEQREVVAPYRYDLVVEAIKNLEPVYWVEGESTADALIERGVCATTSIAGSKNFDAYGRYYSEMMEGANIVIVPDNDESGLEYAKKLAKMFPSASWLCFGNLSVWTDNLPKKNGRDAVDFFADGGKLEHFLDAVHKMPPWERIGPEQKAQEEFDLLDRIREEGLALKRRAEENNRPFEYEKVALSRLAKKHRMQLSDLLGLMKPKRVPVRKYDGFHDLRTLLHDVTLKKEFLVEGLVPSKSCVLFLGDGGCGKTELAYSIAHSIDRGLPFSGMKTKQGRAAIFQNDEGETNMREKFLRFVGDDTTIKFSVVKTFRDLDEIARLVKKYNIKVAVFDCLRAMNKDCGYESREDGWANGLADLKTLCGELDFTAIVLHHVNKNNGSFGTSYIRNVIDEEWKLEKDGEESDAKRVFSNGKTRVGIDVNCDVKLNPSSNMYELVNGEEKAVDRCTSMSAMRVFFLRNAGVKVTPTEIVNKHGVTMSLSSVKRACKKLAERGEIFTESRRVSGKGRPSNVYWSVNVDPPHTEEADLKPSNPDGASDANLKHSSSDFGRKGSEYSDVSDSSAVDPKHPDTLTATSEKGGDQKPEAPPRKGSRFKVNNPPRVHAGDSTTPHTHVDHEISNSSNVEEGLEEERQENRSDGLPSALETTEGVREGDSSSEPLTPVQELARRLQEDIELFGEGSAVMLRKDPKPMDGYWEAVKKAKEENGFTLRRGYTYKVVGMHSHQIPSTGEEWIPFYEIQDANGKRMQVLAYVVVSASNVSHLSKDKKSQPSDNPKAT